VPADEAPVEDSLKWFALLVREGLMVIVSGIERHYGLRRLRLRGLVNANIQGLLIAAGQNLKRFLAATGWGRRHAPCGSLLALPGQLPSLSAVSR
jgi:hypothetical protein